MRIYCPECREDTYVRRDRECPSCRAKRLDKPGHAEEWPPLPDVQERVGRPSGIVGLSLSDLRPGFKSGQFLGFEYTNHRGVTEWRVVRDVSVFWGVSPHHTTPQMLVEAFCMRRQAWRCFAVSMMRNLLIAPGAGEYVDGPAV